MRPLRNILATLLVAILIISVWFTTNGIKPAIPESNVKGVLGTSQSTQTASVSAKSGSIALYPDTELTPGDIFPGVTDADICRSGYSSSVRDVPVSEKRQVYAEYNLAYPQAPGAYEVDHFISLELGGSNDIKNLWPEPADPKPGFHQKDEVENYLHSLVCSGKESLSEAQNQIRTDWYAIYLQMPH